MSEFDSLVSELRDRLSCFESIEYSDEHRTGLAYKVSGVLSGECWVWVAVGHRRLECWIIDLTLKNSKLTRTERCFEETEGLLFDLFLGERMRVSAFAAVDRMETHVREAIRRAAVSNFFTMHDHYMQYLLTKFVQAESCEKLMVYWQRLNENGVPGYIEDIAWIHASRLGGTALQAMKSWCGAKELIR